MIKILICDNQISRAKKLYKFDNLKGSITNGKSNIFGALGEILVFDFFKQKNSSIDFNSNYDYDLIINDYKIDVKTKKTTVIPQQNYLCSISSFNIKQKCDYYFFVRIKENLKEGYLLGYKSKKSFFEESFFKKKGSLDVNGFVFKDDCYNLEIRSLNKFRS